MTSQKSRDRVAFGHQKARIVLSIGQLGTGGAEGQLALLAEGLVKRGHNVHVASLFFQGGPLEERIRRSGADLMLCGFPTFRSRPGKPPTILDIVRLPLVASRFILAFVPYIRWLRATRPHIVMSFLFHAYVITAFASWIARVPVLVTGRRSLGNFKEGRHLFLWVERWVNHLTDAVVANSDAVATDVVRQEHLPRSKLHVINNGLPETAFEVSRMRVFSESGIVRIICVANFHAFKGHSFLLQAAAMLRNAGHQISLLLVGDGPLQEETKRMAQSSGIDATFVGSTSDVRSQLASADIFVLPSFEEGFSNALLEAMAVGLPIVATDVGGNAEALDGSGLLVPARNSKALAEAIASLIENPPRAARLGTSARERALTEFKAETMVSHYVHLFHALLSAREGLEQTGE